MLRVSVMLIVGTYSTISGAFAQITFEPEERITFDETRNFETTRNPNHSLAVDSTGTAHLAFWHGGLATNPDTPSGVWYASRSPEGTWTSPLKIDDSYVSETIPIGGRHPSLAVSPAGTVSIFWHDYRHCSESQRWIDNTEIYLDRRQPNGEFLGTDIRLTTTNATHSGDNGYTPQVIMNSDGRIRLAWYDFHFNAGISDLFLMQSDANGDFPAESLDEFRLTDAADRGNAIAYGLPDLAIDSTGDIHLVWTNGQDPGFTIYYAKYDSDSETLGSPVTLSSSAHRPFFDPPRIVSAPNSDIVALWTENRGQAGQGLDVMLARLRSGETAFDPPVSVVSSPANQTEATGRFDAAGRLHLTWIDERDGSKNVFYGLYDIASDNMIEEQAVTQTADDARKPALALGAHGEVHIVWTDFRHGNGQIYSRRGQRPARAVHWRRYE